ISWTTTLPFGKELTGDTTADGTPDSEDTTAYSDISSNLLSGLQGYWKFNESSWNNTAGEVKDSSGKGRHGRASTISTISDGFHHRAAAFWANNHGVTTTA